MSLYKVSFFKHLVNAYGRRFKILQGKFDVEAPCPEDAQAAAGQEFETEHHIPDWHLHADECDCEICSSRASSRLPKKGRSRS
jgi:hypothetical protein